MSTSQFPIGSQVWAMMPEPPSGATPGEDCQTEVLAWVVGYERGGNVLRYLCKAPESYGIWTLSSDEVVSGVTAARPSFSMGSRFELGQAVRVNKEVEWRRSEDTEMQKCGRISAGWCKRLQGPDGYVLEYTYWVTFTGSDRSQPRNWYHQGDLES